MYSDTSLQCTLKKKKCSKMYLNTFGLLLLLNTSSTNDHWDICHHHSRSFIGFCFCALVRLQVCATASKLSNYPFTSLHFACNDKDSDSVQEAGHPIISPLSHGTAAHPSCRSGHGRGSTAWSHQAAAPRWHLYTQTGSQGWVPCTAPWPAQTPGPPTDPHSSWSVTGDRQGGEKGKESF